MGEYQGRRRGRPDPESEPGQEPYQDPDAGYGESPYRHYESYDQGYGLEPQYAPGYVDPGYPAQAPYGTGEYYQDDAYQDDAGQASEFYATEPVGYEYPDQPDARYPYQGYGIDEPERPGRRGRRGGAPAADEYYDDPDRGFDFPEQSDRDLDYAEPRFERVNRRAVDESRADRDFDRDHDFDRHRDQERDRDHDFEDERGSDRTTPRPRPPREPFPGITARIATAAATLALLAASLITPQAVAAVTAALQVAVAWAILALLDLPGRRAVVIAVLPALAADAGTFAYSPDVGATAVAAAIGCGFVLAAADTVLTSRRRGVVPGASRDLAAAAVALVFTGMTALYVAAARLDHLTVTGGAVLAAVLALGTARSRVLAELSPSGTVLRSMAVGLPFAAAAVASYAAAILVA